MSHHAQPSQLSLRSPLFASFLFYEAELFLVLSFKEDQEVPPSGWFIDIPNKIELFKEEAAMVGN
jgi:hypothetical protein